MAEQLDLETGFDEAAPRYDLLVALNPGYHHHLRAGARDLVDPLAADAGGASSLVDLGCGSGASTIALTLAAPGARVVGVDASSGMLAQARRKPWPDGVEFIHSAAQRFDAVLADRGIGAVDGVFAAYLLRNVPDHQRDDVVTAVASALRPGGRFVTQEYSVAGRPLAIGVWSLVCWLVVVPLSVIVRGHPRLYRYLWRSVLDFDSTAVLADRFRRAGLVDVRVSTVGGWQRGILHTVSGRRP
ncbi:class I SAM-dependent methyltransferase [Agilicoccus flavus]|uniref:class I SAM-dependent methyltransferase n=1 Tax=Agilicoccus flavus TaxID=2775968 RepID=UPI001CF65CED|nr:class I SAM-dependent methyltransferase [Agilicoccus flavus]